MVMEAWINACIKKEDHGEGGAAALGLKCERCITLTGVMRNCGG